MSLPALTVVHSRDLLKLDLPYRCTVRDASTGRAKQVLRQVSGHVVPGEMCALVGPSGAGKSTLLDILAMRKKGTGVEGDVSCPERQFLPLTLPEPGPLLQSGSVFQDTPNPRSRTRIGPQA